MNFFFVLYPLGIGCECWLIYHAVPLAMKWSVLYGLFLIANLIIYVPGKSIGAHLDVSALIQSVSSGSYILFTSRMSQRRSASKGKGKAKPHTQ